MAKIETYLVGGAVRDQLLGHPVKERDYVVVGARAEDLLAQGFRLVGKDFPVFLHPETHEEYALARTERKIAPGYAGFICHASPEVTLEEDLQRRDLTINAIAQTATGTIIDPYGGQQDLAHKTLRHVSPAFAEDPVRILRVARFAARFASLGFTVAPETMRLMQSMVRAGEVKALVAERVWQEFHRALETSSPDQFIYVLRQCGALGELFPEIDQLFGVPNPPQWHPEIDSGVHTLMVLAAAARLSPDPLVRFASLLHDLGKATTPLTAWPSHPEHEQRGATLIQQLCRRYLVPRHYQELAILTAQYHTHCHRALSLKPATLLQTLERLDAFRRPERFQKFLLACEADFRGRTGFTDKPYPQSNYFYQAYQAAAQVSVKPLLAQGLSNDTLKAALHEQRLLNIKNYKHTYDSETAE